IVMGKRASQRKNVAMLDNEDSDSVSSNASSSVGSHMQEPGVDEAQADKGSVLDQSLDALYEKRGSTREKGLEAIIQSFNSSLQLSFVEDKFATMLHQCLNSVKKGSAREVALASHAIGLLALTAGPGQKAEEILKESIIPLSDALRNQPQATKMSELLECLAVNTFVGGDEPEQTEKSMQIMWQVANPKLRPNVATPKPVPSVIATAISSWSFLLTTLDSRALHPKSWQESVYFLSTLMDKDDKLLRIAAGEALALIFEMGSLEKFCGDNKTPPPGEIPTEDDSRKTVHIHGLKNKVLNQVRGLSTEAGGKGSAKKDLNNQRNTFRDILDFLEDGYVPESSTKIGGDTVHISTWAQFIQLNFLKHFLGGGFVMHMQVRFFFLFFFFF
ncbi:hypothetical protein M569_12794, partial [Genlisea aurea]